MDETLDDEAIFHREIEIGEMLESIKFLILNWSKATSTTNRTKFHEWCCSIDEVFGLNF